MSSTRYQGKNIFSFFGTGLLATPTTHEDNYHRNHTRIERMNEFIKYK